MNPVHIVNPNDSDWTRNRYLLEFGMYHPTRLLVWANGLEDALDVAIDWIEENAPGLLVDEQVNEAYNEAIAEGKSEEEAQVCANTDVTCGGNAGHYIASEEWHILSENPSRKFLKDLIGEYGQAVHV